MSILLARRFKRIFYGRGQYVRFSSPTMQAQAAKPTKETHDNLIGHKPKSKWPPLKPRRVGAQIGPEPNGVLGLIVSLDPRHDFSLSARHGAETSLQSLGFGFTPEREREREREKSIVCVNLGLGFILCWVSELGFLSPASCGHWTSISVFTTFLDCLRL